VLLKTPNPGFVVATPVGIALGSVLAAMALWGVASLAKLPPLQGDQLPERADGILTAMAVPAIALYGLSAARYLQLWRRRPSLMLLSMLSAFVLLAEAMLAVVFARDWAMSWWEWHLLLFAAFGLVAAGARIQWHEERFADLYLDDTVAGHREMSVLFADLQGFTSFSENHDPGEVASMLNEYFEVAVPAVVKKYGGDVDRIIGDALMATFNKRGDQADHARRAAAAALALQESTTRVAQAHPHWPRFRVGVNSGPMSVSLLGTEGGRTHTVIGDTVNVASRIEGKAPSGGVAIGPGTKAQLPDAVTEPLGMLELKGKAEPVEAYRLIALDGHVG